MTVCSDLPEPGPYPFDSTIVELIDFLAMKVMPFLYWLKNGAIVDDNETRMVSDFLTASDEYKNSMIKLPLSEQLKQLVEYQAKIFWLCRGAKYDNNFERINTDYYDAKRYVGYLIADTMIHKCLNGELEGDCFSYISEEFIDYLKVISVEEYIRTTSYFSWLKNKGAIINNDRHRMDNDYFEALQNIYNSMVHCNDTGDVKLSDKTVKLVTDFAKSDVKRVIAGKKTTISRLQCKAEPDGFVNHYYCSLGKSLEDNLEPEKVARLLRLLYENNHIPNMLEFIFRCFLCRHVSVERHQSIRADFKLPPPTKKKKSNSVASIVSTNISSN